MSTSTKGKDIDKKNVKAELGKELLIKTLNEIGALAEISKVIAEKGLSVLAVTGWVEGVNGFVRLVTDDNLRASEALRKHQFEVQESKVVLVELPHTPGMLKHVTEQLAEAQIDIRHLYATAPLAEKNCLVVFSSSDNDHAVVTINS